ncbi:MAG: outer membrane protein assembly factor BamA, partial [Candidatus Firestonebacteria bacterium]|nr:outer membrane protein assembly factor BamA [Candidatus Firestonebacteria bacterium]
DGYYKENIFKGDLKKIIDFYKDHGYVNAKILNHKIEFDEKTRMHIYIDIYEGPQYRYGEVDIKGNNVFSKSDILSFLTLKSGELYNQKEMNDNINIIMLKYAEKGYIYCYIKPEENINEEQKTISFVLNIQESIQMYLNRIDISGNDVTKDKVIRREMTVSPGEIFNSQKVRRSIQRIYNLGFFQDVNIDTEPANRENNLNLKLKIKEKPTGQANFAATYSGTDGIIGQIQIAKNNLFGYGQRVDLTYEFGKNIRNYEFGFTDPYILDTKFLFGFNIFNTNRTRYTYDYFGERDIDGNFSIVKKRSAYEYHKTGGGIELGRALSENLRFSLQYNYENGEYFTVSSYPLPSDVILGKNATRSLTYTFVYDSRDNVFNPSTGAKYRLMWEGAGGFLGGDNNYNKVIGDSFWYQKTFSKFILMLHMQMGIIDPYGSSDDVPPIEKFSIGGGSTVRGYGERDIADRKRREFIANLEHKYPIEENINFVTFIDTGNAWDQTNEIQLKDLKSGVGIGFHMETPIGPIRFDYGWGLNLEPGDEKGRFHFNLGWGFY